MIKGSFRKGLSATRIFPTLRDKYNIKCFDQQFYNHYQHWTELGRPENFNAENETNNNIYNEHLTEDIDEENLDNPATSSTLMENKDLANGCETCKKIGP